MYHIPLSLLCDHHVITLVITNLLALNRGAAAAVAPLQRIHASSATMTKPRCGCRCRLPFPWPVLFIFANEAAERFCYYGARAVLVLYLTSALGYSDGEAISIYSFYLAAAYYTPLLGGYISDVYLGRFKTILCFNVVYLTGLSILSAAGFTKSVPATFLGLVLVAIGTGGVKPNVGVLGADQLVGADERTITSFWLLWYASINGGASLSYIVTPIIREEGGYGWAFLASLFTMAASVVLFLIPSSAYVQRPPAGVSVYATVGAVLSAAAREWERVGRAREETGLLDRESQHTHSGGGVIEMTTTTGGATGAASPLGGVTPVVSAESTPLMGPTRGKSPASSSIALPRQSSASAAAASMRGSTTTSERSDGLRLPPQQHFEQNSGSAGGSTSPTKSYLGAKGNGCSGNTDAITGGPAAASWCTLILWGPVGCGPFLPRCCGGGGVRRRPRWSPEDARGHLPDDIVDGGVALMSIFPIFACLPLFWALHDAQDSIWQVQRKYMNNCLTADFCITPEQLGVVNPVLCMIFVPTLDRLIIPALYAVGLRPTALRRMGLGMQIAASSYVVAALLQVKIDAAPVGSVSVLYQLPQIFVITFAEMLVSATGLEFAYSQAPKGVRGSIMALFFASSAVGDTVSGTLYGSLSSQLSPLSLIMLLAGLMSVAGIALTVFAMRYKTTSNLDSVGECADGDGGAGSGSGVSGKKRVVGPTEAEAEAISVS